MKVIVVGCGKFGARVTAYLTRQNHDVTVIDSNPESFHLLNAEFTGEMITGIGYDRDVLESAGINVADVLISCASSDSLNAVIASVAKNSFHVPMVIARMYDPIRAKMFESMGIYTVSITRLGVDNIQEYLEAHRNWRVIHRIGDNEMQLVKARVSLGLEGTPVTRLNIAGKLQVISVERNGHALFVDENLTCEIHDMLYLAISRDYLSQARDLLQV